MNVCTEEMIGVDIWISDEIHHDLAVDIWWKGAVDVIQWRPDASKIILKQCLSPFWVLRWLRGHNIQIQMAGSLRFSLGAQDSPSINPCFSVSEEALSDSLMVLSVCLKML